MEVETLLSALSQWDQSGCFRELTQMRRAAYVCVCVCVSESVCICESVCVRDYVSLNVNVCVSFLCLFSLSKVEDLL